MSRPWNVNDICRAFGIPAWLLVRGDCYCHPRRMRRDMVTWPTRKRRRRRAAR